MNEKREKKLAKIPYEETMWFCPRCSYKLYKPKGIICPSKPPQVEVRCLNCDYKGFRIIELPKKRKK